MDARRTLLTRLFDHAAMFPPASMSLEEALAEDDRARASEHAWLLARFVVPEGTAVADRELATVGDGIERQDDVVFVEGETKIRCGGARVPSVEELAAFVRDAPAPFKATAGLHHAYPTWSGSGGGEAAAARTQDRAASGGAGAGEHGFLNLLAAVVFGDEEEALRAPRGSFELDDRSFRWDGREADAARCAEARRRFHSIGSCSFFEPVGELEQLGIL